MKINWKEVCKSSGYLSLKEKVRHDLEKKHRSKKELQEQFRWVISRAIHYSYRLNKPIQDILNEWESKCNHWWLNYYQNNNQPKLNRTKSLKPKNTLKYYRTDRWYQTVDMVKQRKKRILQSIHENQMKNSTRAGKKARWSNERKARAKRLKA